jgi:hypothetical protein
MKTKHFPVALGLVLSCVFAACGDHNPSGSATGDSTKPFMAPATDSSTGTNGNVGTPGSTDTTAGKTTTGKDTANKKY